MLHAGRVAARGGFRAAHDNAALVGAASGVAVLTGLEPATSALTGRRALQLLHRTLVDPSAPNGIRTRATALKGRRPGPLDDEGGPAIIAYPATRAVLLPSGPAGGFQSIRDPFQDRQISI